MDSFQQWPYPDDHLSETPCERLITSSLKPKHGNGLLPPNRKYLYRVALVYSQALLHRPETLLQPCGLKKYKDHLCLVPLLQPNAQLKASHRTNEPVSAPNTVLFLRWGLRRMQTVCPPLHHHNLQDVQHVETSLRTGS